jgi:hypothetical protein
MTGSFEAAHWKRHEKRVNANKGHPLCVLLGSGCCEGSRVNLLPCNRGFLIFGSFFLFARPPMAGVVVGPLAVNILGSIVGVLLGGGLIEERSRTGGRFSSNGVVG